MFGMAHTLGGNLHDKPPSYLGCGYHNYSWNWNPWKSINFEDLFAGLQLTAEQRLAETFGVGVSRDYLKASQAKSVSFQCQYEVSRTLTPDSAASPVLGYQCNKWGTPRHGVRSNPPNCKLWGLACDLKTNNLYYTDRASHEVVCISNTGDILFKFGQDSTDENERLLRPTGIAYDDVNNRLVIADKDNHRVAIFSTDGKFVFSFGSRGHLNGTFHYPWGIAVSPNGEHIAVADSRNKRIQLFDKFGNFVNKYSVFERSPFEYKQQFDYPRGVSFDATGKYIYVSDFNLNNIIQLPLDFSMQLKMIPDGQLRRPQGIAVDSMGNILFADSRNNCVRQMAPNGDLLASIKFIGTCRVDFPVNLTVMSGGWIAVLDGNGKLHMF